MKAVIIAGGKGTRLGLPDIPKPMVSIGGLPLLEHQIRLLSRYGIKDILVLTGYLSEKIEAYFGDGKSLNVNISYLKEKEPLGTAGAVKQLEPFLHDRFLTLYGDLMLDFDIDSFRRFDNEDSSIATIITHPNDHPFDSDLVVIDENDNVSGFLSKPHPEGIVYNNLVNAGVYILSPDIFKFIIPGNLVDFGKHIFPNILRQHRFKIRSYNSPEFIKDAGTPERLSELESAFLKGKIARLNKSNKRPAIFLDRDGVINEEVNNLSQISEFRLLPDVSSAITEINRSEYLAIVVTNQPAVAKGFLTFETLMNIHKELETTLGKSHAFINKIYYCPHHPEKGFKGEIPELKIDCNCRKPKTGMIDRAGREFNIDLKKSYIIGDTTTDIMTGINAGLKTILVRTGYGGNDKRYNCQPEHICKNLLEAVNFILNK